MLEKPAREKRDPEQAKKLRLLHDRVNAYGENDKASRKVIPRFKAQSNRSHRHAVAAELKRLPEQSANEISDDADARIANATFHGLHPAKRKVSDIPNAIGVAGKLGIDPPLDEWGHLQSGAWARKAVKLLQGKDGKAK